MKLVRHMLSSGLVLPVLLITAWAAAVHLGWLDVRLWSSPEQVLIGGWAALRDGTLVAALAASLQRDLIGFAIGAGLALPLGLLLARVRLADRLFNPTLNAARQVALFAWVPFLSLWLGNGELGRLAFIALASFFPVLLNTHLGAARIEPRHLEVARILCLKPHRLLLKVVLPSALPGIMTGLRLGLIYSWLATIGAEYLFTTTTGIGSMMMDARDLFRMDLVILGMAVIGGIGFALQLGLNRAALRFFGGSQHSPLS
jgi:sulfonate transport system permease protein